MDGRDLRLLPLGPREPLRRARFTGYTLDGGYAEQTVADARFCFPLPAGLDDVHQAPLLCAGLIGYRALRLAGEAQRIGFFGFGSSAHLLAQVVVAQRRELYAFTRDGDDPWAGVRPGARRGLGWRLEREPPVPLDAAIVFAPSASWWSVRWSARAGRDGGLRRHPHERHPVVSVRGSGTSAASARWPTSPATTDGSSFRCRAPRRHPDVTVFPLEQANEAIRALREGPFAGSAVLTLAVRRSAGEDEGADRVELQLEPVEGLDQRAVMGALLLELVWIAAGASPWWRNARSSRVSARSRSASSFLRA